MAVPFIVVAGLAVTLFIILLSTVAFLAYYLGVFDTITPRIDKNHVDIKFIGKCYNGDYTKCGEKFSETLFKFPKLSTIGVYLDDPGQIDEKKLRYIVGSIVSEDDKMPLLLAEDGYQKFEITDLEECVRCSMRYSDTISIVLKLKNAYAAISGYLAQKMLLRDLGVMIEIYPQGENRIEIFGDLAKNESLEQIKAKFQVKLN